MNREREKSKMKCAVRGCPGEYEPKLIVHTVKHGADVVVFEDVPADVCRVCSDTLLASETIRHLEAIMRQQTRPRKHAPVYAHV